MIEYDIIRSVFVGRKARRTNLPYIRHIDQGLYLLRYAKASQTVLGAWCLHPLFQLDEYFLPLLEGKGTFLFNGVTLPVLGLAMEYRASANSYLTSDERQHPDPASRQYPRLSPVKEVNLMLQVDKVQNYRDARLHLYPHITNSESAMLDRYFQRWLGALGVSSRDAEQMEKLLEQHDQGYKP